MSETAKTFWNSNYSKRGEIELPDDIGRAVTYAKDFFGSIQGKKILDLGCGTGGTSVFLARAGANVTALDFSEEAIENLQRFARENDLNNLNAVVGDAMKIDQLGEFDYIFGSFILHHLEPFSTFCEVLRCTLKKDGLAFFYENNAASDLLIWFRRNIVGKVWVPRYGDEEEFPLTPSEVNMLRKHFQVEVMIPEMIFFHLASVYILKRRLLKITKFADDFLFRLNIGKKYSYRQYVIIRG